MLPLQQKWLFFGHFWLLKFQFDLRFVWPIYVTENNNFAPILPGNVLPCCMWAEQRVNIRISNSVSGGGTFDRLSIKLIIKICVISFPANTKHRNASLSKFALSFLGTQSDTVHPSLPRFKCKNRLSYTDWISVPHFQVLQELAVCFPLAKRKKCVRLYHT